MTLDELKNTCNISSAGCWEKKRVKAGQYGAFRINGVLLRAHRVAWMIANGEIPDGLYVCHKCNNKRCINPEHLYLATHRQNIIDACHDGLMNHNSSPRGVTLINLNKQFCDHGHEFTKANTYFYPSGKRGCKACRERLSLEYYYRNIEKRRASALQRYHRLRKAELEKEPK